MARFDAVILALAFGIAAGMALQSPSAREWIAAAGSDLQARAGPYVASVFETAKPALTELWEGLRCALSCAAVFTLPLISNAIAVLETYHAFVKDSVQCPL